MRRSMPSGIAGPDIIAFCEKVRVMLSLAAIVAVPSPGA